LHQPCFIGINWGFLYALHHAKEKKATRKITSCLPEYADLREQLSLLSRGIKYSIQYFVVIGGLSFDIDFQLNSSPLWQIIILRISRGESGTRLHLTDSFLEWKLYKEYVQNKTSLEKSDDARFSY
jgi:hypothetical protein